MRQVEFPKTRITYSVAEVADFLGVSIETIRREIRGGRLKASRMRRRLLITPDALDQYLKRPA